ncbi:hypothetical protein ILYODFUR_024839 [Ilyodon furcidens]|uniref:Uncharacterized protein n=1 Tax=Ilyodon furcidens TaxID=33524 RepID=A0ABV0U876_9TELE
MVVYAVIIHLCGSNKATRRRQGQRPHWDFIQKPWTQIQDIPLAFHHPVRPAWLEGMTDCRIRTFYTVRPQGSVSTSRKLFSGIKSAEHLLRTCQLEAE